MAHDKEMLMMVDLSEGLSVTKLMKHAGRLDELLWAIADEKESELTESTHPEKALTNGLGCVSG